MSKPKTRIGYQCKRADCIYKGCGNRNNYQPGCDYSSLTGKCRSTQPGGEHAATCKLYIPKGEDVEKVRKARIDYEPPWEHLAKALYDAGHTDETIAAAVGVSTPTIARWRAKRGLKSHHGTRGELQSINTEKAMELYKAGKSDREIAQALACSATTIYKWRRLNGLESLTYAGRPKVPVDWDEAMRLYEQGLSDVQIGKALGCSFKTINRWRRKNNLPSKHLKRREEKKDG